MTRDSHAPFGSWFIFCFYHVSLLSAACNATNFSCTCVNTRKSHSDLFQDVAFLKVLFNNSKANCSILCSSTHVTFLVLLVSHFYMQFLCVKSHSRIVSFFQDASRCMRLPVPHLCPIKKVVWSSFDYVNGPQLGFTWEVVLEDANSANSLSESPRDIPSMTSSMTKCSVEYEEIDNAYKVLTWSSLFHN